MAPHAEGRQTSTDSSSTPSGRRPQSIRSGRSGKSTMMCMLSALFVLSVLLPGIVSAQNGKIRGKVADSESGKKLIGASILVEETTLGAATDIDGEFVVLNVPPGNYTVRASSIGFAPVSFSNIIVNAALTTTLDFELPPTSIQTEPVLITAEPPIVLRNSTNTVRITSQEDVQNIPVRGTQAIVALNAGVVQQDGSLHVRGGRTGELAFFVDGASVTNRMSNSEGVSIVQEAFEELQFQPGGFTAEFGGATSGIVNTTVRTGGSKFHGSVDYRTDDFAESGEEFLGTSSFGYRNAVVTVGGPVEALKMRYFAVGQYNYQRSPARWVTPFRFDSVRTDANDVRPGRLLPGPIQLKENALSENSRYTYTGQGTLLFDLNPVRLKLTGSYSTTKGPGGGAAWPAHLNNIFNLHRQLRQETDVYFVNLRATHILNPQTFYEIGVSTYYRGFEIFDPRFGSDFMKYPDSLANAPFGDAENYTRRYQGPARFSVGNGFRFQVPGTPVNAYQVREERSIESSVDFVSQISKQWEFKAGGRLERWKMRRYSIHNIQAALEAINGLNGNTPVVLPGPEWRRILFARQGSVDNFGYDVFGNKVDGDFGVRDAPKKPLYASAYFQNKLELRDLVLGFGLRYEHFSPKAGAFNDPVDYQNTDFDRTLDIIIEENLLEGSSYSYVLPRINFSFPVTDRTVFFAQYGKYVQMPDLSRMYTGFILLSRAVSPISGGGPPVGFEAKPERLTQYEVGFRRAITDFSALTVTGFYKDTKDQLAVRSQVDPNGNARYAAYLNKDFSIVKGLEITFDLRRRRRLSARLNYTLQDARGTGSNPTSSFGVIRRQDIGRFPDFITALDFHQRHRGSLILDYRFEEGDGGSILQGLGALVLLTFNSGRPYTKVKEDEGLGASNPYNIRRRSFPIEESNASSTPSVFNVDLFLSKVFYLRSFTLELYTNILNILNTRHVINVYRNTGKAEDDGWLTSPQAAQFRSDQEYVAFYRAFNVENRWAYAGRDVYGTPRQLRFGVRLEY